MDQLEVAYNTLVGRKTTHLTGTQPLGKDGAEHPRIVRSVTGFLCRVSADGSDAAWVATILS